MKALAEDAVLVVVDLQPRFMGVIQGHEAVLHRAKFMVEVAHTLGVPVLATEQNVDKMGGTEPGLAALLARPPIQKMHFSCCGSEEFTAALAALDRELVVLVGIETPICVTQTALDLLEVDCVPYVVADAVGARTEAMQHLALERLRDSGAVCAHSEQIAYEWMETADHPQFRAVLELVKRYGPAA